MKLENIKYVFITGVSKGIGFEFSKLFLKNNIFVVGVARNTQTIVNWAKENNKTYLLKTFNIDLTIGNELKQLFKNLDEYNFDLIINNAGYGLYGQFKDIDIEHELNMIDLNIKTLQIITKYFVKKYYLSKVEVRIINIASIAAFQPGPLLASYYATKSYVLNFSNAINYEMKRNKSKLKIISLCPGIIKTDFWKSSNYQGKKLPLKGITAKQFCKKSFKKIIKTRKDTILIGLKNKSIIFFSKYGPKKITLKYVYNSQKNK